MASGSSEDTPPSQQDTVGSRGAEHTIVEASTESTPPVVAQDHASTSQERPKPATRLASAARVTKDTPRFASSIPLVPFGGQLAGKGKPAATDAGSISPTSQPGADAGGRTSPTLSTTSAHSETYQRMALWAGSTAPSDQPPELRERETPSAAAASDDRGGSYFGGSSHQQQQSSSNERVFPIRSVVHVKSARGAGSAGDASSVAGGLPPETPISPIQGSSYFDAVRRSSTGSQLQPIPLLSPRSPVEQTPPTLHQAFSPRATARAVTDESPSESPAQLSTPADSADDSDVPMREPRGAATPPWRPELDSRTSGTLEAFPMTVRFEHAVTDDGQNWVVTGREGTLQRCEDEPIHCPGAVQAFGALIVIDEVDDEATGETNFVVQQVSENTSYVLGLPPSYLFRLASFTECLTDNEADTLQDALDTLDDRDEDPSNTETGPHHFQLSGKGLRGTGDGPSASSRMEWTVYCAAHRPDRTRQPHRLVLEFEHMDDRRNPLSNLADSHPEPDKPSEGLVEPTKEDLLLSTVSLVKPLRALTRMKYNRNTAQGLDGSATGASSSNASLSGHSEQSSAASSRAKAKREARRKKAPKPSEMDVLQLLQQINEQLLQAEDLEEFLKLSVGVFKELTEFDRVMIYQFDEKWNGRVVSELVDYKRTKDLYRGLHFPASDIPPQARELYKINKVRLLYDRDQPTARMCCRTKTEVDNPLNMTQCHLRAMSPIHVKYLNNMGVRASMSVSITAFGKLWGLISLHTYGRYGHRVSFPVRQLCKLLGDSISRHIERLSYARRIHSRKLINTVPTERNPSGYIVAKAEDLLALFDADFGVLSIGDEGKILGALDNSQELLAVLEYLRVKKYKLIQATEDIARAFPDIDYPAGFKIVSGILYIPLSSEGVDFIAFFRKGKMQEVHWAGNPYANKQNVDGSMNLEPRKSFKIWSETVVGISRSWTDEQLETADVLCLVYSKFIDVWRQKENALAANQLTSLLLANASHEVRTPLNAIINYLEMALEGAIDPETRENLNRSHAASRTLIHVINDLLDLTRTEKGKDLYLQDPFDFPAVIEDAVSVHREEGERRGLTMEVVEDPPGTPPVLLGDRGKIRQIVGNVVGNAVKHTEQGGVRVQWGELADANVDDAAENKSDSIRIGISITDTGVGIPSERLERIFREFEQVTTVDDLTAPDQQVAKDEPKSVGLGLAVVARIVRNLGGQLRVESKEGQGSKFTFILPFRLPSVEPGHQVARSADGTGTTGSVTTMQGGSGLGVMMEPQGSTVGSTELVRSASGGSKGSSQKSEIDSLINAMSKNPMGRPKPSSQGSHTGSIKETKKPYRLTGQSNTLSQPRHARRPSLEGFVQVEDSAVPIRPIKVAGDEEAIRSPRLGGGDFSSMHMPRGSGSQPSSDSPPKPAEPPTRRRSVKFEADKKPERRSEPAKVTPPTSVSLSDESHASPKHISEYQRPQKPLNKKPVSLHVLVVEDEMINRNIIQKRLQMEGHTVTLAIHGGEALRIFESNRGFDMVLMDLQMPICDGYEASRGIRELEKKGGFEATSPTGTKRASHLLNGRVPIFAVSASLREGQKAALEESGIDGWMLKPVDFKRLAVLMLGAIDLGQRKQDMYKPGHWEKGGWLRSGVKLPKTQLKKDAASP